MKHTTRQRVLDPVTGLKVTKIETVNGELGSGITDCNGREIFEGDIVKNAHDGESFPVTFEDGSFWAGDMELANYLEVVGHVDD